MARTVQTARKSTGGQAPRRNDAPLDEEDQAEINDRITEEDLKRRAELEKAPMQAELKHLEKRWTKKGHAYITEPKEDEDIPEESVNWYEKYALCVTRQYDAQNRCIVRESLQVNSTSLKDILKDVIGNFPGQSFHTSNITIDFPGRCLYHYRDELTQALEDQEPGSEGAAHLPILLAFIDEQFEDAIKDGDNLREQGLMSYEHLWTIFKPGTIIFSTSRSQPRAYELQSYQYICGQVPALQLSVTYVDYDGDEFGTRYDDLYITSFRGAQSITSMNAFPFHFHSSPEQVRESLISRGRHWEAHAGQNFREYTGIAIDSKRHRYNIDGRIMIDTKTFHRIKPDVAFNVDPFPNAASEKRKQAFDSNEFELVVQVPSSLPPLTNDQCLLASDMVRGFSFTEKKFLDFSIGKVSPIQWNTRCFQQLVLPDSQKELVQALVAEHTARVTNPATAGFDDIVKGKGKGLILVLHGPPGVGKTLTAECVAEFAKRPLYIVSSGELGTHSGALDERLTRILDLASTWKAVLLIDEADVFLERRSLNDMERNSMVSIFLRTLEYYSGILFMTTNRVNTFDDAFKSRIHVPLKYGDLPHSSRVQIWKNFLSKTDGGVNIDEAGYQSLGEGNLNGRQIKNVVRTAKSLAAYKKRKLDHEQLEQVMKIQMAFEKELEKAGDDVVVVEQSN